MSISKKFLLSDESVDDDFENDLIDEDELHKAPLIKESKLVFQNGKSSTRKKIRFNLSNQKKEPIDNVENSCKVIDEDEDDDNDDDDQNEPSKHSLNTPPPITIGKIKIFKSGRRHRALRLRRFIKKLCTLIFTVLVIAFVVLNINRFPQLLRSILGINTYHIGIGRKDINSKCDQVVSVPVWKQNFPMLTVESSLRMLDVNNDSVLDVIVPFGTGIDAAYYDSVLCQIYFNQTDVESKSIGCGGGVMALDGNNGEPIWAQYTPHELFAANCDADLNNDGQKDCIIGGRMASLYAISGNDGKVLWSLNSNNGDPIAETSNFYTPLLIPKDIDGDSIPEIVVMHGGDPLRKANEKVRNVARLILLSGKTGQIINWSFVPDNSESYYSPQLLIHPDGTNLILFGTGGETHPGGLYVLGLDSLINGKSERNSRLIFQDCCKGVITPPTLIDINGDEIFDIIMAHYNSTVIAFDGLTFEQLWHKQFPGSETYSTPSVGYFNNDDVPDFGVVYQYGPGFPIYYYAEFNVLDGRNGQSLLKQPIRMPIGTQSSPLTISTFAQNDIFLFWYSSCSNSTHSSTALTQNSTSSQSEMTNVNSFQIQKSSVHESSRADFCKLRYGNEAKQFTQYRAITPFSMSNLYDSRVDEPVVETINYTQMAYQWYQNNLLPTSNPVTDVEDIRDKAYQGNQVDAGVWGSLDNSIDMNANAPKDDQQQGQLFNVPFDQFRKYKKWLPPGYRQKQYDEEDLRSSEKRQIRIKKRHVGLHNGDSVQRVISTGTLAPSLAITKHDSNSIQDQLQIDGSIDVIFATYSFPPSSKLRRLSPEMKACIDSYMTPEKETEMRLIDESSPFKRLGYDHDGYESAVNELCAKETGVQIDSDKRRVDDPATIPDDPVKANEWARELGSMTVHRVNIKCYDSGKQHKQIPIKEYHYQWWPSYLGILADAVANVD